MAVRLGSAADDDAPPRIDRRPLFLKRVVPTGGVLSGMRIRKKLIVLHTAFSLALGAVLLLALRPAIAEVVLGAELDEAKLLLDALLPRLAELEPPIQAGAMEPSLPPQVRVSSGSAEELGLDGPTVSRATTNPGRAVLGRSDSIGPLGVAYLPAAGGRPERYIGVTVTIGDARSAVSRLYIMLLIALLAVYALVAVAIEGLVLPTNVYAPIRRMLEADRAVQDGRRDEELIDPSVIPSDELGEIMRSRNDSILKLRAQGKELAAALQRLEEVANDLKRKNHLLESARRNLADADRLASLGMMSAGIAHELNTPLAVVKGLAERLHANGGTIEPAQAALMKRVVGRIERLGESLLDFARARPPRLVTSSVGVILREAATLVSLDRETSGVPVTLDVRDDLDLACDPDRLVQVFVNLIRNAAEAVKSRAHSPRDPETPGVRLIAGTSTRDGREWVAVRVIDDGPGIDPAILPRLFEPFASTRLDSRGTGLGLAVAEGIVREHGGLILARNRADATGAVFEVVIPRVDTPEGSPTQPQIGDA
ncbi:MAG: sensor histidine kinase [Phycisphaerales bacterium]